MKGMTRGVRACCCREKSSTNRLLRVFFEMHEVTKAPPRGDTPDFQGDLSYKGGFGFKRVSH